MDLTLFTAAAFGTLRPAAQTVPVDALSGLWLETLAMLPICLIYALWQARDGHAVFPGRQHHLPALLIIGAGIITALPDGFAAAANVSTLSLAMIGMLMYINPTLQFLTAVYLFDEPMQTARLVSFGLMIWLGLLLYTSNIRQNSPPDKAICGTPALRIGRFHHPAPMAKGTVIERK